MKALALLLLMSAAPAWASESCTTTINTTCGGAGGGTGTLTGPGVACDDNDVARWDGATTTVLQCSAATLSDAGGLTVTALTDSGLTSGRVPIAGVGGLLGDDADFTFATDTLTSTKVLAPTSVCAAAAAGAANSVCTTANTITAEGATANAANTRIVFGDAAAQRDLYITAQAGTGTVRLATAASPTTFMEIRGSDTVVAAASAYSFAVRSDGNVGVAAAGQYVFGAVADPTGSGGLGIERVAAGVAGVTDGSTGVGWLQTAGRVTLAADFTNATITFSNTALSLTVTNARKYTFVLRAFVNDSTAADGIKWDFEGGTATATNFRVHCTLYDTALLLSSQATALATDFTAATVTGSGMVECAGSLEPSATGTFILRAAQNAHTTGTLTVYRGSYLWMEDVP